MIWKDRIIQYPHRYTLTNVIGTTYDFEAVTGEVNEVGTPVSAENMNKLLQRDGDDIKDTVTTFSEAGTRANIATGESTSTIFGKIKKWFSDLKAHAFSNPSTTLNSGTTSVPSDKLLNDTAALKANATNPNLTGQMSHNGQQFGIYPLTATEASTNYIKVASIYLNSLGTGNSRVVFHGFLTIGGGATEGDTVLSMLYFKFRSVSGVFSAEIMGYTALKPSTIALLGSWYYTVNPTTKYVDLFYKPLGGWRNACLTVMGVSKLANDTLSLTNDNLGNALPYDTGSTANPTTPSGGQAGTFGFNDYKQFVNQSDISTVMPISSAAASNSKVLGEKTVYDEFTKKANRDNPTFTGTVTVPAPTNPTDAANKRYVDSIAIKQPDKTYVLYHATAGTNNLYLSAATYEHTYADAGAYLITISGSGSLATVDWGDGTSGTVDVTGGFNIYNQADKDKYIEVHLGTNCAVIGDYAFSSCIGLTSITIPNSVTSIGEAAFYDCNGLTSTTLPNTVTSIGEAAFSGCTSLTSITLPNSVTSIGGGAFEDCIGLTSITIPNSVTSIGEAAFYDCNGLTSINFMGNSLPTIGSSAFSSCRIADIIAQSSELADSAATAITNAGGTLLTNYRKLY